MLMVIYVYKKTAIIKSAQWMVYTCNYKPWSKSVHMVPTVTNIMFNFESTLGNLAIATAWGLCKHVVFLVG